MRVPSQCALAIVAISVVACRVGYDAQPAPCTDASGCGLGMRCAEGRCVPADDCVSDTECGADERCATGSSRCLRLGSCLASDDCPADVACSGDGICAGCGGTTIDLLPGNLLVVLDRTASMGMALGESTRWEVAKAAISRITQTFDGRIRFGLVTYSACLAGGCSPGEIVVPMGDDAGAIDAFLGPLMGVGSPTGAPPSYLCDSMSSETSTGGTLESLVGEPALSDPSRNAAVLLLTDGAMSADCAPPTGAEGAAALLAQRVPVRTFAIGVGDDALMSELEAIASAGGTMRAFRAEDEAALDDALDAVAGDLASCTYALSNLPADPALVYVFADGARVTTSDQDGFTLDEATQQLRFHGDACDRLVDGTVSAIEVVFACAE